MTGKWIQAKQVNPALCRNCKKFAVHTWDFYVKNVCTVRFCDECARELTAE